MNEQEFNQQQQSESPAGDPAGTDVTRPLGVGDFDDEGAIDPLSGIDTEGGRRISSGAMVLGAVVLLAIIGLFSMRTITRATAAPSAEGDVEKTVEIFLQMVAGEEGTAEMASRLGIEEQRLLQILNESYASRQVSLEFVQRNPFIIFESRQNEQPEKVAEQRKEDPRERKRADLIMRLEQASDRVEVRSILKGQTPLANIGGRIVGVGQTITIEPENVTFRITEITTNSVTIVGTDRELGVREEFVRPLRERAAPGRRNRGPARPR